MKKFLSIVLAVCAAAPALAQDFHLSQYDVTVQYMNPALTGMFCREKGDYRIVSDYRSQWHALGIKPYNTMYLAYDQPYENWDKKFGIGACLINNRGGSGHFNTLNFLAGGSYDITGGAFNEHWLTTGLQIGLLYKSFDPSTYTYDVQYSFDEGDFDTSIDPQENFARTSRLGFDANMGINYKYMEKEHKVHPQIGLSVQHIPRPKESFTGTDARQPMRWNYTLGATAQINDKLKIIPMVLVMTEARTREFNIGCMGFYKIKDTYYDAVFGLDYRHRDAACVLNIGLKNDRHVFRFSYDINTSYLNNYTNGRGAWEFSLYLVGIKGEPLIDTSKF